MNRCTRTIMKQTKFVNLSKTKVEHEYVSIVQRLAYHNFCIRTVVLFIHTVIPVNVMHGFIEEKMTSQ